MKRLDLVRENRGIRSNIIAVRQGSGRGRRILTRKDPVVKCACTHVHIHYIHCVCVSVCMDTYVLCSYNIIGWRDIWHLLHRSTRAINAMHPKHVCLYPEAVAYLEMHCI